MKAEYKFIVVIVALAVASNACRRSSTNNKVDSSPDVIIATDSAKSAKWTIPEPMMQHMRNLEQDVRTLESSSEKDHTALAVKLDEHTTKLISSCTMDGKAHNALHDWLMPFLQLNKDYAAAPDAATRLVKFKEIQDSLAVFHEHFE